MKTAKEICPTTTYKKAFEDKALLVDVRESADVEKTIVRCAKHHEYSY